MKLCWGSQCSVPGFQQHALQKQPAVALQVGLVQPHGQVAQGEVAVRAVCELFHDGALQTELPPVHVGELAGNLVETGCGPCVEQQGPLPLLPVMVIF